MEIALNLAAVGDFSKLTGDSRRMGYYVRVAVETRNIAMCNALLKSVEIAEVAEQIRFGTGEPTDFVKWSWDTLGLRWIDILNRVAPYDRAWVEARCPNYNTCSANYENITPMLSEWIIEQASKSRATARDYAEDVTISTLFPFSREAIVCSLQFLHIQSREVCHNVWDRE